MNAQLDRVKLLMDDNRWREAVEVLEGMLASSQSPSPKLLTSLIASLAASQNHARLQEIIPLARSLYPNDEAILSAVLRYYDSSAMWKQADEIVDELIDINPEEPRYYFRQGRIRSLQNKPEQKKEAYQRGLELIHHEAFDEIVNRIVTEHGFDPATTTTTYDVGQGHNNVGLLNHTTPSGEYITKIGEFVEGDKESESIFYAQIRPEFPQLQDITPEFMGVTRIDGVQYLTLAKHSDDKDAELSLADTIELSKILTSTSRDGYLEKFPNAKQDMTITRRSPSLVKIFTQIHTREANEVLLTALEEFMLRERKHRPTIGKAGLDVVADLKRLVLGNRLYEYIDPQEHYALVHPDLGRANVLIAKEGRQKILIDWHTFKSSLDSLDVVAQVFRAGYSFDEIHRQVTSPDADEWLDDIEKIFFLYAYISLFIMARRGQRLLSDLENYVSPALNVLETLVKEFVQAHYSASENDFIQQRDELASQLRAERAKYEESLAQRKQTIEDLQSAQATAKEENEKLRKTLDALRSSKSWKLTKPLRALTGGSGKKN